MCLLHSAYVSEPEKFLLLTEKQTTLEEKVIIGEPQAVGSCRSNVISPPDVSYSLERDKKVRTFCSRA